VQSAVTLSGAHTGTIFQKRDELYHLTAQYGYTPEMLIYGRANPIAPGIGSNVGRTAMTGEVVQIPDVLADPDFASHGYQRVGNYRAMLGIPLKRNGKVEGVFSLAKPKPGLFEPRHVELVQTFADQAVIAIENARLLAEQREALEQQTATAAVLQVINSSPGELAPVFEVMLEKATRLCGAGFGSVWIYEGKQFRAAALHAVPPALAEFTRETVPVETSASLAELVRGQNAVHVVDLAATELYRVGNPVRRAYVDLGGARSLLSVALRKDDALLGAFNIYRQEVRPFSDKQIALVQNFAAQAVIAIENARLITQTREALEQQTATADVLKTISRSSVDLETVLDTLVETVARLCRADQTYMFRRRDDLYHLAASHGLSQEAKEFFDTYPFAPDRGSLSGRVELERRAVHIPDVLLDAEYTHPAQKLAGYRTMLGIPLLRGDELIGIFAIDRTRVEPFTSKEIELATSFADQAVIAIENARLFEELRDRQAELRVTFDNMGDGVVMFGADTRLVAWNRNFQIILDLPDAFLAQRPSYADYFRYLVDRGEYSADLEADLTRANEDLRQELRFERTRPDGRVIEVRRNPVPGGGFVLIYSDVTQRKRAEQAIRAARDAAESALRELQIAQASLVHAQKMAALGQLTAGIAHEIKNPLNFVNNFAALSSELTDELSDVLKPVALPGKVREEVKELTGTLKDNLGRVVQHGKRADSIVKNMLLHSREGSGERRPAEINAIVEESLNLAYHGARAEKQGFNITLERDFDPAVGVADIYPQEVTRALLNLISNGFYAATKRAAVTGDGFEPKLTAATRNLGDKIEVRIRDNGTGISPDIREKIFNPFFTTKPAGEGTGLGLSMSHDIVVKQHGGTIEVVTEPGSSTEFIITLPRLMP
jgi:PAS domain S-box-containing protein